MLDGFKKFILRGNVLDLAVGVIIGAAFGKVVESLVQGLLTPFIGAIAKVPDFSNWQFETLGSKFMPGMFVNALVSFIIVAAAVYFGVILPMNKLMARMKKTESPTTKACQECLSTIHIAAKRCPACTTVIA